MSITNASEGASCTRADGFAIVAYKSRNWSPLCPLCALAFLREPFELYVSCVLRFFSSPNTTTPRGFNTAKSYQGPCSTLSALTSGSTSSLTIAENLATALALEHATSPNISPIAGMPLDSHTINADLGLWSNENWNLTYPSPVSTIHTIFSRVPSSISSSASRHPTGLSSFSQSLSLITTSF